MGVMAMAGEEPEPKEPAADAADDHAATWADVKPAGQDGVSEMAPESRRGRARRELDEKFGALEKRLSESEGSHRERMESAATEIARLQGTIEEMRRAPRETAPIKAAEDPEEIRRVALDKLDQDKDLSAFTRAISLAGAIEAEKRMEGKFRELQERIPQPVHPAVQAMLYRHPAVAEAGAKGTKLVALRADELREDGWEPGPKLMAEAFRLAEEKLSKAGKKTAPSYGNGASAALSNHAPRGAAAAEADEDGPQLSPEERAVAKATKMTDVEYRRFKNPSANLRSRW